MFYLHFIEWIILGIKSMKKSIQKRKKGAVKKLP